MVNPMTLLLVVGYVAALGLGAYEFTRAPALSMPPAPPEQVAKTLPPLEIPPDVIKSIAAYDAIVERPLFASDRRPEAVEEATVQTDDTPPDEGAVEIDGFRLTAVLRDGDSTTVLIEDRAGQTQALHEGDQLGNWRLGEILDDRVSLLAGDRQETLMVYDFSPPIPAARAQRVQRVPRRIQRPPQARAVPADRNPARQTN